MAGTLSPKAHNSAFRLNFYISLTSRPKPGPSEPSSFLNIDGIAASVTSRSPDPTIPPTKQDKRDQR